mgnify:FL=1
MRTWSLNGLFFLKVVLGQTTINPHGLLLSSSTETMMAGCWSCISEPREGLKSTSWFFYFAEKIDNLLHFCYIEH